MLSYCFCPVQWASIYFLAPHVRLLSCSHLDWTAGLAQQRKSQPNLITSNGQLIGQTSHPATNMAFKQ